MDKKHLGQTIRKMRGLRGLKAIELAKLSGLSQSDLSQFENGINYPKADSLANIAKALQVCPSKILSGDIGNVTPCDRHFFAEYMRLSPENKRRVVETVRIFTNEN